MKIIFGLGNIGKEFESTYHNAGFMAVDECLLARGIKKSKNMCSGLVYEDNVNGQKVYFVKPTTYMNNSGECVKSVMTKLGAENSDILVVVDDFDLPAGSLRIRQLGSAGTHNGLKSIVAHIGTSFARLRIGTGHPETTAQWKDFVLSSTAGKNEKFLQGVNIASKAVLDFANGKTIEELMQKYNGNKK